MTKSFVSIKVLSVMEFQIVKMGVMKLCVSYICPTSELFFNMFKENSSVSYAMHVPQNAYIEYINI